MDIGLSTWVKCHNWSVAPPPHSATTTLPGHQRWYHADAQCERRIFPTHHPPDVWQKSADHFPSRRTAPHYGRQKTADSRNDYATDPHHLHPRLPACLCRQVDRTPYKRRKKKREKENEEWKKRKKDERRRKINRERERLKGGKGNDVQVKMEDQKNLYR